MGIAIVMPCFNEAAQLDRLLAAVPQFIEGRPVSVTVVDDGSTDSSAAVARSHGAHLIRQRSNQGKGAALRRAMQSLAASTFDALVWMDSDGQHLPSSVVEVVRPVLVDGVDLCIGSRYLSSDSDGTAPFNRRLVRAGTVRAIERVTGSRVTDPFSGFRCFSPSAAAAIKLHGDGYQAELESYFAVKSAGLVINEVAIPRIYGPAMSKMGHAHGAVFGRVVVVAGYARTLHGAWLDSNRRTITPTTRRTTAHG